MLFNSYIFILFFLPLSLLGYFTCNHFKQYTLAKCFLTGMSLWFYAYFEFSYLGIMLSSIFFNYVMHRLLLCCRHKKLLLAGGIFGNLALLFYFKYFTFCMETLNSLFHTGISLPEILLPLGISFFTFQQIAFLVDTARGEVTCQPLADYMLFVTFFPQLVAGPIVSQKEMLPQFQDISLKHFQFENFYKGICIFVPGLFKKVLLADTFGQAVNWGFLHISSLSSLSAFLVILFYTFQIYFDFSGYCDMARGIGCMFNITIPVNFLSPYKAASIKEFWDCWHITLTRFFTHYLYIPLGGSRKGIFRTCLNVFFIFFVSGIWHGAGFTFLVWGCMHGVLSVLHRIWRIIKKQLSISGNRLTHTLSVFFTFLFIMCSWTFFRAESVSQALDILKKVVNFTGFSIQKNISECFQLPEFFYLLKVCRLDTLPLGHCYCMFLFILAAVILVFFTKNLYETEPKIKPTLVRTLSLSVLFVWCILSLSGISTFLYFNF